MTNSVAFFAPSSVFPVTVPGFQAGTPAPLYTNSIAHRWLLIVTGHGEPAVAVMNGYDTPGEVPAIVGVLEGTLPAGARTFKYVGDEAPVRYLSFIPVRPGRAVCTVNFDLYPIARLRSTAFRVANSSNVWEWGAWKSIFASEAPRERVVLYQKDVFHLFPGTDVSEIPPALQVGVPETKEVSARELTEEFLAEARAFYRGAYIPAGVVYSDYVTWLKEKFGDASSRLPSKDFPGLAVAALGPRRQQRGPDGKRRAVYELKSDGTHVAEIFDANFPSLGTSNAGKAKTVTAAEVAAEVVDTQPLLRTPALKRSLIVDLDQARRSAFDGLTRVDAGRDFVFTGYEEDDALELVELSDRVEVAEFVSDVVGDAYDPARAVASPEVYELFSIWSVRHRGARPMPKAEFEAALTWVLNV